MCTRVLVKQNKGTFRISMASENIPIPLLKVPHVNVHQKIQSTIDREQSSVLTTNPIAKFIFHFLRCTKVNKAARKKSSDINLEPQKKSFQLPNFGEYS